MDFLISFMVHPTALSMVAALLIALLTRRSWHLVSVLIPSFIAMGLIGHATSHEYEVHFAGFSLSFNAINPYRYVFEWMTVIIMLAGGLVGVSRASRTFMVAAYGYIAAAFMVYGAGDVISLWMGWEWMALCAVVLIWQGGSVAAKHAGIRYAALHLASGALFLAAAAAHIQHYQGAELTSMPLNTWVIGNASWEEWYPYMMCVAVLIHIAAYPFAYLAMQGYTRTTPLGMVFLAAGTTKTALFVLMTMFPGSKILIPVGITMLAYGILYSLMTGHFRRMLVANMVGQLGVMLIAIGNGGTLALDAAAMQMMGHVLYQSVMLLVSMAFLEPTASHSMRTLNGPRAWHIVMVGFGVALLAASGMPGTVNYLGKALIGKTIPEGFLLSCLWYSAMALLWLPYGLWGWKWFVADTEHHVRRPVSFSVELIAAIGILTMFQLVMGSIPTLLTWWLPGEGDYMSLWINHSFPQLLGMAGIYAACILFAKRNQVMPEWRKDSDTAWNAGFALIGKAVTCAQQAVSLAFVSTHTHLAEKTDSQVLLRAASSTALPVAGALLVMIVMLVMAL